MMDYFDLNLTMDIFPIKDNVQWVEFKGNIDKVGLQSIKEKLEMLVDEFEGAALVFNFEKMNFINSEGIGFLLVLHSRLVKRGKKLLIYKANSHVKDVFEVIGLSKIMGCYETEDQILEAIKA